MPQTQDIVPPFTSDLLRDDLLFARGTTIGDIQRWYIGTTNDLAHSTGRTGLCFSEDKGYHKVLPNGTQQQSYKGITVDLDKCGTLPVPTIDYSKCNVRDKEGFAKSAATFGYLKVTPLKWIGSNPTTYNCYVDTGTASGYTQISINPPELDIDLVSLNTRTVSPYKIVVNNKLRTVKEMVGAYKCFNTSTGTKYVKYEGSTFSMTQLKKKPDAIWMIPLLQSTYTITDEGVVLHDDLFNKVRNMDIPERLKNWFVKKVNQGDSLTTKKVFICSVSGRIVKFKGSIAERMATLRDADIPLTDIWREDSLLYDRFRMCNASGVWHYRAQVDYSTILVTIPIKYYDSEGVQSVIPSGRQVEGFFNSSYLHNLNYYYHSNVGYFKQGRPSQVERMLYNYSTDVTGVRTSFLKHSTERQERLLNPNIRHKYRYFGLELEVIDSSYDSSDYDEEQDTEIEAAGVIKSMKKYSHNCILKSDGSLDTGGVEIVTVPATLKYWQTSPMWDYIENETPCEAEDYDCCGLHIHVSKNTITPLNLAKVILFFSDKDNLKFLEWIAGRPPVFHCAAKNRPLEKGNKIRIAKGTLTEVLSTTINAGGEHSSRYSSVNVCSKTVEFRLFQGVTKKQKVLSALEFCDSIINFCDQSTVLKLGHKEYLSYMKGMGKRYPNLRKTLSEDNKFTNEFKLSDKHEERVELCA